MGWGIQVMNRVREKGLLDFAATIQSWPTDFVKEGGVLNRAVEGKVAADSRGFPLESFKPIQKAGRERGDSNACVFENGADVHTVEVGQCIRI
jgi:hypothetical protein